MAAAALNDIYHPAFLTRIGLRYQDVIDKTILPGLNEVSWNQLIRTDLVGLLGAESFQADVAAQSAQTVLRLAEVPNAMVRINHGLRDSKEGIQLYYFDADFFVEGKTEVGHVSSILDAFHRASGNLFRWAITSTLFEALEPQPI